MSVHENNVTTVTTPTITAAKAIADFLPTFDGDSDVSNFLMCQPDLTDWPQVKTALREHFGYKIDRQTLMREFLQLNKYRNKTILDFLERLKQLKSRIEVKIQTDAVFTQSQKTLLIDQNKLNAVDLLAANFNNRLRLLLDLKQPDDLSEASDLVLRHFHNETRINALSKRHELTKP
ncbi:hypothetical protein ILUMI_04793 [Ignelater luminosus]|uniref:Retrotransposon gag domain-containing protein n=1 Tax=Ignelater luminosus TaxID=2038154 RepID=A0A8K0GE74_IGNLU|nr:hypothetical protein ILUMI_04793 [Ignelater luminosus]